MNRYARQMALPEIQEPGQARLQAASVLVVGAGGLGCAVLQHLSGAGCGRLVIVDPDRVEESNLHRQPLYRMSDLGVLKATAARTALLQFNPRLHIDALSAALTPANADVLARECTVVVDAADNFAATYTLSDACQRVGKPLVSASVLGQQGYVGTFCGGAPSYRAVFPELPQHAGACNEQGVLGTAVGVVGSLQAHFVLALLLQLQPSVLGRCVSVQLRSLRMEPFDFSQAREPALSLCFIAPSQLRERDILVDLRSEHETCADSAPLSAMQVRPAALAAHTVSRDTRVVFACKTGLRAWRAGRQLQRQGHENVALLALGGQ